MNTREENVAEAMREEQAIAEKKELRQRDLKWAQRWHGGDARCPNCGGTDFGIPDAKYEDQARYESFRCLSCSAFWKVELRETALVVLHDEDQNDDDWIELETFEEPLRVQLSERERATMLAALHYWGREGALSVGHERDIGTDFERLNMLTAEEIDELCERIKIRPGRDFGELS